MYALHSTITETGVVPAAARVRPDTALWQGAPGGSVRHVLRSIASEPATLPRRRRWRERARRLVDREHATLRARFEADGLVEPFLRGRTRLADGAVIGLLHLARAEIRPRGPESMIAPLTILALGGYGRRELAPGSDLDLLFLLAPAAGERTHAERLIGFVLAGLWDLGFEVGHATRSAAECRGLAASEPTVLASLLDARFLAGCFSLHGLLDAELKRMASADWAEALAGRIATETRTPAAPAASDDDEPDVKRGRGALRDIQRLLWLTQLSRLGEPRGAPEPARGPLEAPPTLVAARRFLWQVRAHLHLLAGRAQDRLERPLQPAVATRLGLGHGGAGATALRQLYRRHTHSVRTLLSAL
jgi:[protein-PII] uridylyltransferase